jgi:nucleoside-diphosphate-sugar epimerase
VNPIIENDLNELLSNKYNFERMENKTVLIAGANSLIGRYLAQLFLSLNEKKIQNIKVVILVRNSEKAKSTYREYLKEDYFEILNQDIIDPISYEGQIDYIFHFAGSASPKYIIEDSVGIIKANTIGTINILDLAKEKGVIKVVFASTREVYGKTDATILRIKETDVGALDQIVPRNCYPESKRIAESLFVAYAQQYGVNYSVLRIAHTYGPGMIIEDDGRVMADFIGAVVRHENIFLNSDGTARRSFCYITDAIDGILRATLSGDANQVYNLANETEPYPIRDVAQMLSEIFPERNINIVFANEKDSVFSGGYSKIPLVQMDTSKLEKLSWKSKVSLREGMKRTVQYYDYDEN